MEGIPYRFDRDASAAELAARFASLEAGADSGVVVSVAGRLMLRREMGKLAFGTLRDSVRGDPAVRRRGVDGALSGVRAPVTRRLDRRYRRGGADPDG